ncbi:hypothetical protein Tco_0111531 [Tanacetum coccineum]
MLVPPFQFHLLVITMEDPKSSSNPFKSVNAIKTRFKSTNALPKDQQQLKTLTVDEIETLKPKEPEKALEYEFKDLHLNLPVLEVLAHAPKYNALLDKYVESLDLGKMGRIRLKQFAKTKMTGSHIILILPCRRGLTKRHAFWSLNEDILKITVLTTNTPYPSRKIRRICACTHQRPRRKQDPIRRIQKKAIRRIQAIWE